MLIYTKYKFAFFYRENKNVYYKFYLRLDLSFLQILSNEWTFLRLLQIYLVIKVQEAKLSKGYLVNINLQKFTLIYKNLNIKLSEYAYLEIVKFKSEHP